MANQLTENYFPIKNILIYNDIYDLGITKKDADLLDAYWNTYQGAKFTYIHSSATAAKDFVLSFMNAKEAIIKLAPKDEVAAKAGYGIFCLENYRYYLKFIPTKKDIVYLNALGEMDNKDKRTFVFNNMSELRDHLFYNDLSLVLDQGILNRIDIELIYWAAGKLDKYDSKLYKKQSFYSTMPDYIKHTLDVIELPDDTRVCVYIERSGSTYGAVVDGMSVRTYVVKPNSQAYNWTDKDRYFSHFDKVTELPKVFYAGPDPTFPAERAISKYARGQRHVVIENPTLENVYRRDQRKTVEEAAIAKARSGLKSKMETRLADLAKGKEFSFNDVTFRQHEIEYEGQILAAKDITTKEIVEGLIGDLDDDMFNFEKIYEKFCDMVIDYVTPPRYQSNTTLPKPGATRACIGVVEFELERVERVNAINVKTTMYYINGARINKDELQSVLLRAICYTKSSDFTKFLESVSACSLRYHKVISSGILLKVKDEILDTDLEFKIGLDRDTNRNYISFTNGSKYVVKDTNRLLSLEMARDMTKVINVLLDPNIVGISGKEIRDIIENGKAALELERMKQNEMLAMAVKMFNCQKVDEVLLDNGREIDSGYTVKGKLREYLIDEDNLRVFEYPTGKYLCMVDKGQNEHANIPRLVSRMFALANDSKLANEISTLQKTQ